MNDAFEDCKVEHVKTLKALDERRVMQCKALRGYSAIIQNKYISCIE